MSIVEESFEEFERYLDRGNYYRDEENYIASLNEYGSSLKSLSKALEVTERLDTSNGKFKPSYDLKYQIGILFILAAIIRSIVHCYNSLDDYNNANKASKTLREILESLQKHESAFDVEELKKYQDISEAISLIEATTELKKIVNESKITSSINSETEEASQKIWLNFGKICSLEVCLLSSRKNVNETTQKRTSKTFLKQTEVPNVDSEHSSKSIATDTPSSTSRDWRDSVIIGSLIGGAILIGLFLVRGFNSTQPSTANTSNPNVTTSAPSEQSTQIAQPTSTAFNPFENTRFPKSSCGDPLPTESKAYPVTFYPVYVEYSDSNLEAIKYQLCNDAYRMRRKDIGAVAIQVASFNSFERAKLFANLLSKRVVRSAEVGMPTKVESRP